MTSASSHKGIRKANSCAFTLTELLLVITIISVLLGLLYGAIRTVSRFSRETITRGELANIEAAFKQYYNYYHVWPSNDVESANSTMDASGSFNRFSITSDGDVQYEIGPQLASMLSGHSITNNGIIINPDAVPFIELTRYEVNPLPGQAAPISAWGVPRGHRYFVKLDLNGDNTLSVPTNTVSPVLYTTIYRSAAAWTVHPEKSGQLLGSWIQ